MKVETKCKFCHRDIEMDVDQVGFENPAINAAMWLRNVACNRCAAYYQQKAKLADKVARVCDLITNGRRNGDRKQDDAARGKLVSLTQELCKLICDFKCSQMVWDISFVEMLMEQPHQFSKIINSYTANLSRIIRDSRATQNDE